MMGRFCHSKPWIGNLQTKLKDKNITSFNLYFCLFFVILSLINPRWVKYETQNKWLGKMKKKKTEQVNVMKSTEMYGQL